MHVWMHLKGIQTSECLSDSFKIIQINLNNFKLFKSHVLIMFLWLIEFMSLFLVHVTVSLLFYLCWPKILPTCGICHCREQWTRLLSFCNSWLWNKTKFMFIWTLLIIWKLSYQKLTLVVLLNMFRFVISVAKHGSLLLWISRLPGATLLGTPC